MFVSDWQCHPFLGKNKGNRRRNFPIDSIDHASKQHCFGCLHVPDPPVRCRDYGSAEKQRSGRQLLKEYVKTMEKLSFDEWEQGCGVFTLERKIKTSNQTESLFTQEDFELQIIQELLRLPKGLFWILSSRTVILVWRRRKQLQRKCLRRQPRPRRRSGKTGLGSLCLLHLFWRFS